MAKDFSTGPPSGRENNEAERDLHCRLLLDTPGKYSILSLDAAGAIVTWSEGARTLYGYTEGEILGKPLSMLFSPDDIRTGAPERWLQTVRTEGSAASIFWRVRKDGSSFCATVAMNALGSRDSVGPGFGEITID